LALPCVRTCIAQSNVRNVIVSDGMAPSAPPRTVPETTWSRKSRGTNFTKSWNVSGLVGGDAESPGQCVPPSEGPWQQLQVESSTKEINKFLRSISRKVNDRHGSYVTTIYARVLLCRLTCTRTQTKALTATAELPASSLLLHLLSSSDLFYAYFRHIDKQPSHFMCFSSSNPPHPHQPPTCD
jgi:hypothetical protein